jgi:UDP-3-O-[3-hydroxymyristoyl] glucosamine N-acyltransferase
VFEADSVVGAGARIGAQVVIGEGARVGADTRLFARVVIYPDCEIGQRGIVHAGTVIGADGFGFAREAHGWAKIAQLGRVIVGDDVEIGANCTLDRGALDDTVIAAASWTTRFRSATTCGSASTPRSPDAWALPAAP